MDLSQRFLVLPMLSTLSKTAYSRSAHCIQRSRYYSAPAERSIPPAKQKYVPTSGTYPKGFLAGSAHAGVKASNTKYDDVALVVSEKPCPAKAVFTRNLFKAAPCLYSQSLLGDKQESEKRYRGIVVNSGCANAVTGIKGREDAKAMSESVDKCFGDESFAPGSQTLVMSTGVIGQRLPIEKITDAIPKAYESLGASHEHWLRAANAICTTDTFPKLISRTFTLPSHPDTEYRLAGMTKGAGMIHPNMGTLLGIVCTDASLHPVMMQQTLQRVTNASFNRITIDGDTSTNDTLAFFANGAATPAGVSPLRTGRREHKEDVLAFTNVLEQVMLDLAKLVVRDGEGATKFVSVRVRSNAGNSQVVKAMAMSVAQSSLVKTALYGKDANWGRILCAVGYTPYLVQSEMTGNIKPDLLAQTSVSFIPTDGSEALKLLVRGEPEAVDEVRAKEILETEDLEIFVDTVDREPSLNPEEDSEVFEETVYTCDLSHEYVTINGDYRT